MTQANELSESHANQRMHGVWDHLWRLEGGETTFSIHREILERAKWRYLCQDLGSRTSGIALEVGCGSGTLGSMLAMQGFHVVLLDYSEAAINIAQQSYSLLPGRDRKMFVQANAFFLPFADESIDVVVSGGLLEHFENPSMIVIEMARVLKPGGLLYADIWPRRFSLIRSIERLHRQVDGWFEIKMSKRDIFKLVDCVGLDRVRIFTAGVLPPRDMPFTTRYKILNRLQRFILGKFERLWLCLDGTLIADWFGSYYYVTAKKPLFVNKLK